MSKDDYDNELKKCFYNENMLMYKKLNDLAIKESREEEGYQEKQNEKMRRFKEDNAFWLKPSKGEDPPVEEEKVVKEIVMKYDKKSDKFVKEELDEKIDDFVQDIVDYRNEMINQRKINKESALKKIKEIKLEEIELEKEELKKVELEKVEQVKVKLYKCECGIILKRLDGMARHQKTKKHENLMALKVLKEQMEKLSIEKTKNPPPGPVKIKAPSMGGEISYIPIEKSRK